MSGDTPEDHSLEIAKMEQAAADQAKAEEAAAKKEQETRYYSSLDAAYKQALGDASSYFTEQGLDPTEYLDEINRAADSAKSMVPYLDPTPYTYFDDLGATVWDAEQTAARNQYLRAIDSYAPAGFETQKIASTSDDAFLEAIYQEELAEATEYLRNLMDRGVITASGYAAGQNDLTQQGYGAKSRLQELGNAQIATGQSGLSNIANTARSGASNYTLGSTYDPYSYSSQIDQYVTDFFTGLGNTLRGLAPQDLFSTTGLANIAGAAQGAQNLAFDPAALAGAASDDDEDEEEAPALAAF